MHSKSNRLTPWLVLAGIILIRGFSTGINTVAGLFLTPVSEELNVGIGTISLYFSVMSIVQVIWFGYAGKILNKYDIRIVAVIAAAFQALTFAAFGLMNHVVGWYLLAIPQAMGSAVLVNLLGPILINRWFPNNTGTILGIQSAFVGLFGAVLQPVTSNMIATNGWRMAYYAMGVIAFVVVLAGIVVFIKNRPANLQQRSVATAENESSEGIQISENVAIRSVSFVSLLVFIVAMTGVAVFVQHIPTYGTMLGYSMGQIGMVMSVASVGSALGAFAIGMASDRIGGINTCYIFIGVWLVAIVAFLLSGSSFLFFFIAAFLNGLVIPSATVLSPILTLSFFGRKDYEKIYAKVSMGAPLAAIFLVPVYGFIYDAAGSYRMVLIILLGLLALAGTSIAYGWKKRCTIEGCPTFGRKK